MARDRHPHPDRRQAPEELMTKAACIDADPEMFYKEKGGGVEPARKICRTCEVRVLCLNYAIHNKEKSGVWGAMSPRERVWLVRLVNRDRKEEG